MKKICNCRSGSGGWPSAGALCRYRGRGIPHVCADFGFRKELHLQKEKEDSADFKKPVQEDSPQEGIKDRETDVAPSLTAMENTSQTSAQQLTDPEETMLCHPDKKKKTFFPGRIAGFIRKFMEKILYF